MDLMVVVVVVRSDTESESRTLYLSLLYLPILYLNLLNLLTLHLRLLYLPTLYLSLLYLPILVVVRSDSESESRRTPPTQ